MPRTLVFDEIDIGIGGRAAEAVGRKLKALSRGQQVICITHLPQIAAFGDQHFLIEKTVKQGRTQTEVRLMERAGRVEEIARMLSGEKLTDTSLEACGAVAGDQPLRVAVLSSSLSVRQRFIFVAAASRVAIQASQGIPCKTEDSDGSEEMCSQDLYLHGS